MEMEAWVCYGYDGKLPQGQREAVRARLKLWSVWIEGMKAPALDSCLYSVSIMW